MAIVVLFILGIANFAMHKAVLESGHPILERSGPLFQLFGGRFGLALEFIALLGAMLMASAGDTGWAWAYLAYSAVNAMSAWLILSGRL